MWPWLYLTLQSSSPRPLARGNTPHDSKTHEKKSGNHLPDNGAIRASIRIFLLAPCGDLQREEHC
jgi:hypothetical protein